MPIKVSLSSELRPLVDGRQEVLAEGSTVEAVLGELDACHPALGPTLRDCPTGELRRFVSVYLDGRDIRLLQGLATRVQEGARLSISAATAGGRFAFEKS